MMSPIDLFNHFVGDNAEEPNHHHEHNFDSNTTPSPTPFNHSSNNDDDYNPLNPATDQDISTVIVTAKINLAVCIVLLLLYELLRFLLPEIFISKLRHAPTRVPPSIRARNGEYSFFGWIRETSNISWGEVREFGGLDAYMFLRYIRFCLKITSVSAFWGALVLWPIFGGGGEFNPDDLDCGDKLGGDPNSSPCLSSIYPLCVGFSEGSSWGKCSSAATGWYRYSMANIVPSNGRLWAPTIFMYLFTSYVIYLLSEELKHFVELRMQFLTKGNEDIAQQHHYTIMLENIPLVLRSETALGKYFEYLYPHRVHSTSIVLNLPDLEKLHKRRLRVLRRLEKALAYKVATGGKDAHHIVGRARCLCCGIESAPLIPWKMPNCCSDSCCNNDSSDPQNTGEDSDDGVVNSITYYTNDLKRMNKALAKMQKEKLAIASDGSGEVEGAGNLMAKVRGVLEDGLDQFQNTINRNGGQGGGGGKGWYGSTDDNNNKNDLHDSDNENDNDHDNDSLTDLPRTSNLTPLLDCVEPSSSSIRSNAFVGQHSTLIQPGGRDKEKSWMRRLCGKIGFDFVVDILNILSKTFDKVVIDSVFTRTMSSTGFVTFKDLASVTTASSTTLNHKPGVLNVEIAPEPRDIIWANAHISFAVRSARENTATILCTVGALFWSIPVATIQALATVDKLKTIPGFKWLESADAQEFSTLINGYLPVVALLGIIQLLPFLFQWLAVFYENRKTHSDTQRSILQRFFYYQLANIYITLTAGSVWESLKDIVDTPKSILELLSNSLPTVVGYFVSLILTKILAGLPVVLLRLGALSRLGFLRTCFSEKSLTQRELAEVHKKQELLYGWEYPTIMLVLVICFTYACICPIILPVGAVYFAGALLVYKHQVLCVYTPEYESGGSLFPSVCHRTLSGLICGQTTLLAYMVLRKGYYQPTVLFPLPFITAYAMSRFRTEFEIPSTRLSLERAVEVDRRGGGEEGAGGEGGGEKLEFDKFAYRQPVLASGEASPLPHRDENFAFGHDD